MLDRFHHVIGSNQKTRRYPLPADAVSRIASETPILSEDHQQERLDNFPYQSLLGALLYLAINTRPDLSYAVGLLSRFGSKPTPVTCDLMIHVLQYLRGTVEKGIKFSESMLDLHILLMQIGQGMY